MATCGSCGLEVAQGSRFCPSCGKASATGDDVTRTIATSNHPSSSRSSSPSSDGSRFPPGSLLADRYRIVALLGRGGMGEVYRADDLTLGQQVALKFLPADVVRNPDAVARFRNEVRLARRVSHPNVCRVYDLGEVSGQYFLSMEYLDGENLDSLLRRIGRLPGDKALEISRKLCAGLAAAHEQGILHRDLKPANVMLDGRGQAVLTDFGLAGVADQISGVEVRNGTPAYMAPEQRAGKEVTVRSDIYSLGLVLYEIFTGKRPFESDKGAPLSPSSLVRDLDPAVERVILRCLEPDPASRPSSALAVAAALPGGDPLAAALAAGETPSPQMLVAAGEGVGLPPRIAIPVLLFVVAALAINGTLSYRRSALEGIRPEYSPEVLSQKTKDLIHAVDHTASHAHDAYGFLWSGPLFDYIESNDKPAPRWNEILAQRPPLLMFWYRQSPYPLIAPEFHDDHLTPGVVTEDDPPSLRSGMVRVELDPFGRLLYFESLPAEIQEPSKETAAVDWNVLFRAADLDPATLQPTEPLWTFVAASDTRAAWTGTWPGTSRPLRVEAAAFRGKPVTFAVLGPWSKPSRTPPLEPPLREQGNMLALGALFIVLCVASPLLARRNLRQGRGDRSGALRLAAFVFFVQMALWVCRVHFTASVGTFGMFIIAICTSVFYGVVVWTLYLALEPFVRRYWPQTLISWTSVLSGRIRDPIVGRDVLFGVALGLGCVLIARFGYQLVLGGGIPETARTDLLLGVRSTLASLILHIPSSIRSSLVLAFLLFLMRAILRNRWLAGAAFAVLFALLDFLGGSHPVADGLVSLLINTAVAVAMVRLGLLTVAVGVLVAGMANEAPVTINHMAWYFGNAIFMLVSILAVAAWGCYTSMAGRRLWRSDLFG